MKIDEEARRINDSYRFFCRFFTDRMRSVRGAAEAGATEGRGKTDAASSGAETGSRETSSRETGSRETGTGEKVMLHARVYPVLMGIPSNFFKGRGGT